MEEIATQTKRNHDFRILGGNIITKIKEQIENFVFVSDNHIKSKTLLEDKDATKTNT